MNTTKKCTLNCIKGFELLKNTKKRTIKAIESTLSFKLINLSVGDIVIFLNTCPHRSKKNNTDKNRIVLYYTYSLSKNGSKYNQYFEDKDKSKNPSKALSNKQ